jgi:uncharacterized protein YbaA (DUF1428 family)
MGNYCHIFVYRTPKKNHNAMMDLMRKLVKFLNKNGTLTSDFYLLGATNVFQGFAGVDKILGAGVDEEVLLEVDTYTNKEQFNATMKSIAADPEGKPLFGQLHTLSSKDYSIAMGEFDVLKF